MSTLVIDGPLRRLDATVRLPGDKSIAHRALVFAAVADGESRITNLPPGLDVLATRRALERLGVAMRPAPGGVTVTGRGFAALDTDPDRRVRLSCGNSGTTARLLAGLLAGRLGTFELRGDASLRARPMERVIEPLRAMGATIEGGPTLPLRIVGGPLAAPAEPHETGSAQVRGALLLAGLQSRGTTCVLLDRPARDHDIRLLAACGAPLGIEGSDGSAVSVTGPVRALQPFSLEVPGDPSSAAPFAALAAARPGARIRFGGVSVNPTRLGFFRLLERMGARVTISVDGGAVEPYGTIEVRHRVLRGIRVESDEAAACIDELPLVALLGAVAEGRTTIRGASELRVKESDRIAETAAILRGFGACVAERPDGLEVRGAGALAPACIRPGADHRMAMLAAIAAALACGRSVVAGAECVDVSLPAFPRLLARVGVAVAAGR